MKPDLIEIKKLSFLESNPRFVTAPQLQKCVDSLKRDPEFLNYRPILLNKIGDRYEIIAGSVRVQAAQQLGWSRIPSLVFENLTEEKKKRFIILDNAHFGRNDDEILANEYDIEELLQAGYMEKELCIDKEALDMLHQSLDDEEHTKKEKQCPNCGQIL